MLKTSLKTVTAIFLMAGIAHADGGSESSDFMQPVAYRSDDINVVEPLGQPLSCEEARQTTWFLNELARTDGNVDPVAKYGACGADREVIAEFGVDAD